jgi:glycogen debranching enzyme
MGQRDSAYHQGTAWPWLLGPFVEAHYKVHGDKSAARELLKPLTAHLADYGLASLPEIADGADPQRPNGCIAQAWSVAETLRVWRLLAG